MDLARHHKWAGLAFWKTDWLHVFYWAVSGYGERILRATAWFCRRMDYLRAALHASRLYETRR